ncbi:hypothetical protein HJFPF1_02007 [Paramyrothecium foliicola]|nr:hypothetical protein HJFPF1_02007 [Paramyrothecium foliicola]
MSASAMASLTPLGGRCLRQTPRGLLNLQVESRSTSFQLRAVVALGRGQLRYQSNPPTGQSEKPQRPELPKITFRRFAGRALGTGLRNLVFALSPSGIRTAYRQAPGTITITIIMLFGTFIFCVITIRDFMKTFYSSYFSKFPEPVATTLRRAIYYSNYRPDAELALKYYRKAMEQCAEIGLDPFSDEVLGIRIQISAWLEKVNSPGSAVDVLESVLKDCKKWVEVMEQSVKDGKINAAGRLVDPANPPINPPPAKDGQVTKAENEEEAPATPTETLWRKRQRLLAKAVGTSVKLGELYADEHVLNPDKSHDHLVWALETSLKEFQRRRTEGPKPGEESWLTPEELGGEMESLGRNYERKSQFQLAIPLFFQALRLCESPCHRAVIMNNLSAAFAQHPIYSPAVVDTSETLKDIFNSAMPQTREDCLDAALNWARNAYTHAKDVKGDDRTDECDEACAVALCNWGDVAAMMGKTELARKKYQQCIDMSKKMEFPLGVQQAQEGLLKLSEKP